MGNEESTKAMQEALQTAVTRMNSGSDSKIGPDMMSTLMTLLPKLLQNNGSGEEMLERLDTLQKGDLASLREQVQSLRKQSYRMLKSQEQLLMKVHEIQRQQVAAAGAVLDLAQQMARIRIIDDIPDYEDDHERDDLSASAMTGRMAARAARNGNGRRHRET
jgi:hypothetical protein